MNGVLSSLIALGAIGSTLSISNEPLTNGIHYSLSGYDSSTKTNTVSAYNNVQMESIDYDAYDLIFTKNLSTGKYDYSYYTIYETGSNGGVPDYTATGTYSTTLSALGYFKARSWCFPIVSNNTGVDSFQSTYINYSGYADMSNASMAYYNTLGCVVYTWNPTTKDMGSCTRFRFLSNSSATDLTTRTVNACIYNMLTYLPNGYTLYFGVISNQTYIKTPKYTPTATYSNGFSLTATTQNIISSNNNQGLIEEYNQAINPFYYCGYKYYCFNNECSPTDDIATIESKATLKLEENNIPVIDNGSYAYVSNGWLYCSPYYDNDYSYHAYIIENPSCNWAFSQDYVQGLTAMLGKNDTSIQLGFYDSNYKLLNLYTESELNQDTVYTFPNTVAYIKVVITSSSSKRVLSLDGLYNSAFTDGYNNGYKDGGKDKYTQEELDNSYNRGYDAGYTKGEQGSNVVLGFFDQVLSFPVQFLKNAFNFEIFGINLSSVIFFILTLTIIGGVIWFILGRSKK